MRPLRNATLLRKILNNERRAEKHVLHGPLKRRLCVRCQLQLVQFAQVQGEHIHHVADDGEVRLLPQVLRVGEVVDVGVDVLPLFQGFRRLLNGDAAAGKIREAVEGCGAFRGTHGQRTRGVHGGLLRPENAGSECHLQAVVDDDFLLGSPGLLMVHDVLARHGEGGEGAREALQLLPCR